MRKLTRGSLSLSSNATLAALSLIMASNSTVPTGMIVSLGVEKFVSKTVNPVLRAIWVEVASELYEGQAFSERSTRWASICSLVSRLLNSF